MFWIDNILLEFILNVDNTKEFLGRQLLFLDRVECVGFILLDFEFFSFAHFIFRYFSVKFCVRKELTAHLNGR